MTVTVDDLKTVIGLSGMPDEHLQWIIDRSDYVEFEEGERILTYGQKVDQMWITLEGSVHFYMVINGRQVFYYNFENDVMSGGIGGVLPYSRMKVSPGYGYAVGRVRALLLNKKYFPELEELNKDFIQRTIAYMTDRARSFATLQLQQEKVSALGKLSAGIAHELNNPAAAINRTAHDLTHRLIKNFDFTENLLAHNISLDNIKYLRNLIEQKYKTGNSSYKISALDRINMEDDFRDWLEEKSVKDNGSMSETFVEAGITTEELDRVFEKVGEEAFDDVLKWLENLVSSQRIIKDLEQASERISKLVGAIKSHVHMDRSNDAEPTDLVKDIEDTLTILGHKLRQKNIEIIRDFDKQLPEVEAFVGELNQVWMNLIDNAIYAMEKGGKLIIRLERSGKDVKVHFIDNGSGIPEDVIPRIFDPFFTTKKVGEGTGIGLDLVARIIKKHSGDIKISSVPGNTEFTICLPVKQSVKK